MHSFNRSPSRTPGRLTVLAIAIAAALTAGQASAVSTGITNSTPVDSLDNPLGTTLNGSTGIHNISSIGTLSNGGTISSSYTGIVNDTTGTIGTLSNSGTISGNDTGIYNLNSIGTLSNSGTISGYHGINNQGSITSLNNLLGKSISGTYS